MHIVESKEGVDVRAPRRFLHKGAAHSEPELGVLLSCPRAFEQDAFFSSAANMRLPTPALYAIECCEVLSISQVRTRMNNIEEYQPNFEGLVLGCIDADFCK